MLAGDAQIAALPALADLVERGRQDIDHQIVRRKSVGRLGQGAGRPFQIHLADGGGDLFDHGARSGRFGPRSARSPAGSSAGAEPAQGG